MFKREKPQTLGKTHPNEILLGLAKTLANPAK